LNRERIADRFASHLPMPDYLFDPIVRAHAKITFGAVGTTADTFDTSRTVTAIRLTEDGYFVGCLVCHGRRGRKWFARQSPRFRLPRLDREFHLTSVKVLVPSRSTILNMTGVR
jgi:hypothetical protein